MKKQVVVQFLNETDGALRYREINSAGAYIHDDQEGSHLGDVYVRKAMMPNKHPDRIKITMEF
jgi:hypothetical protein